MNLKTPIKINAFGKERQLTSQTIAGIVILVIVGTTQLVNRGGIAQLPLPEAVTQKLNADMVNIAEESKEATAKASQFNGAIPAEIDTKVIHQNGTTVIESANALNVAGQMLILSLVKEREQILLGKYKAQSNNPKNEHCYAVQWTDGACLNSILMNRKAELAKAKSTPSKGDDLDAAIDQVAFALATQNIIGKSLNVDAPLVDYYNTQLSKDKLQINPETAIAQLSNVMGLLGTHLDELQTANNGTLAAIADKSKTDCLGGVIDAEQLKRCGEPQDAP